MNHIVLLGYFIALMVGVVAVVTAQQFYKTYRYPFLRFLVRYIIFLNLALFIYFVSTYFWINSSIPEFQDLDSVFHAIVFLLATGAWVGCIHSFIHLVYGLKGGDVPGKGTRLLQIGLILVGLLCAVGITTYVNTGSNQWIIWTYRGIMAVTMLVFFSGMIGLLRHKDPAQKSEHRRSIRIYGWLHIGAYVLFLSPLYLRGTLKICFLPAAVISMNLVALIWLRRYFLTGYARFSADEGRPPLDAVVEKYQISVREREVMELILEGKSNQEIEKTLFISYNTVKNHIYSIYQKLGVKSRSQMIHLVIEALKRDQ